MPDGIAAREPGGNSITTLRSHSIMWPPLRQLYHPSAQMKHHRKGRLLKSMCGRQTVRGPKLKAAVDMTLLWNRRISESSLARRCSNFSQQ